MRRRRRQKRTERRKMRQMEAVCHSHDKLCVCSQWFYSSSLSFRPFSVCLSATSDSTSPYLHSHLMSLHVCGRDGAGGVGGPRGRRSDRMQHYYSVWRNCQRKLQQFVHRYQSVRLQASSGGVVIWLKVVVPHLNANPTRYINMHLCSMKAPHWKSFNIRKLNNKFCNTSSRVFKITASGSRV